jgi:protein associated with RNAse G/E
MFHIISNSSIGHMDLDPEQHIIDPNTKYIIIAGNTSVTNKRAMLYAEQLAKMYPNSYIIFNHGVLESKQGLYDRIRDGFELHINEFKKSPKNLYFPKGTVIGDYDFYCTTGWPFIIEENKFSYYGYDWTV